MGSRKKIVLQAFLLLLSLLFIAGYFGLRPLLTRALANRLTASGLTEVSFDLALPGLDEVIVHSLGFKYSGGSAALQGSVERIAVSYDFLESGRSRVSNASFEDATVKLLPAEARAENPAGPFKLGEALRAIGAAPIEKLSVKNILVERDGKQLLVIRQGSVLFGGEVRLGVDLEIAAGRVHAEFIAVPDAAKFSGQGRVEFPGLALLPWKLSASAAGERITADLMVPEGDAPAPVKGAIKHDISSGVGSLALQAERENLRAFSESFRKLFPNLQVSDALQGGRTSAEIKLSWDARREFSREAALSIENLSLAGLSAENLKLQLTGRGPDWTKVQVSASAKLLDGEMHLAPAPVSLSGRIFKLPVRLQGISLAKLLAIYPQEKLSASGTLNADFVLEREDSGYRIAGGTIAAAPPGGVIQYHGEEISGTNQQLSIAFGALEDFHYDTLRAPLALDPDGKLTLGLFLHGNNPNWQSGRALEFNINLEENIYSLLQSLRLSRGDLNDLVK